MRAMRGRTLITCGVTDDTPGADQLGDLWGDLCINVKEILISDRNLQVISFQQFNKGQFPCQIGKV